MESGHAFIISRGFKNYFLYSLLFTILEQLCIVVDMILVGNFVSTDAFSALNLVVPVESIVIGLIMLSTGGAGIIASRRIGNQDFEGAFGSLSTAAIFVFAVFSLLSALSLFFLPDIVMLLCPDSTLSVYVYDYLGVYFISLFPIGLYYVMILLLNVDGKPAIVLGTVISASALDIVLDVVFMKYMGMGVKGVALAGAISYTAPLLFLVPYVLSRRCAFRLMIRSGAQMIREFKENIAAGIPYCMPYLIMCLITFVVNTLVLTKLGSPGLYVWSAGYQVLSLVSTAMDCIGGTVLVIMGSMLVGCHDMSGFSILAKRCLEMAAIVVGTMVLFVLVFPVRTLSIFGYDIPADFHRAMFGVRCIVLLGIPYAVCIIKIYISQALDRKWLSTVPLAIFFVLTIGGLCLCSIIKPDWMFPSFLVSGVLFILFDLLSCFLLRGHFNGVSSYLLIPPQDSLNCKCISVMYNKEGLNAALSELEAFLGALGITQSLSDNINLCCEELMLSIIENNADKNLSKDWFFDVFILYETDGVKVTIKDAGAPFNPVKTFTKNAVEAMSSGEDMDLSLLLVNKVCSELTYNYMYGQNTIYMAFRSH